MKKSKRRLLTLATFALLIGALLFFNRSAIRNGYESLIGDDYNGSGKGSIEFVIEPGDDGSVVAKGLVKHDIVKSYRTTYKLILARDEVFYPGTYRLALQMSSASALDALANESNRVVDHVTIKEGLRLNQVLKVLAEKTHVSIDDFKAVLANKEQLGIPSSAPNADGYLFPATYDFAPKAGAKEILQIMVDRTFVELDRFGVAKSDRHRVLTMAALIQKEARIESDFYKVSRVFANRIDLGMHLQSDATVSYGVDGDTVSTSAADRSAKNGYNTYLYEGLPIGPIGAAGSVAIDAALHPAAGKWLYFCAINLATGETVFSNTYAEHQRAVALWRAWMKENPGYE